MDKQAETPRLPWPLGAWMVLESAAFLAGAALHAGLPMGWSTRETPLILEAILQVACGLSLGLAAYAGLAGRSWAPGAAVGAHLFSLGVVLAGVTARAAAGSHAAWSDAYHSLAFISLFLILGLLPGRGRPAPP